MPPGSRLYPADLTAVDHRVTNARTACAPFLLGHNRYMKKLFGDGGLVLIILVVALLGGNGLLDGCGKTPNKHHKQENHPAKVKNHKHQKQ